MRNGVKCLTKFTILAVANNKIVIFYVHGRYKLHIIPFTKKHCTKIILRHHHIEKKNNSFHLTMVTKHDRSHRSHKYYIKLTQSIQTLFECEPICLCLVTQCTTRSVRVFVVSNDSSARFEWICIEWARAGHTRIGGLSLADVRNLSPLHPVPNSNYCVQHSVACDTSFKKIGDNCVCDCTFYWLAVVWATFFSACALCVVVT